MSPSVFMLQSCSATKNGDRGNSLYGSHGDDYVGCPVDSDGGNDGGDSSVDSVGGEGGGGDGGDGILNTFCDAHDSCLQVTTCYCVPGLSATGTRQGC